MTALLRLNEILHHELEELAAERGMTSEELVGTWVRNSRRRDVKPYSAGTEMRFGQYGGERVENVIRTDPAYVKWLLANAAERFQLDSEMTALYERVSGKPEISPELGQPGWWSRVMGRGK